MYPKTLHITSAWHSASGGVRTFYLELMRHANRHGRPIRIVVPGAADSVEEVGEFARVYTIAARPARIGDPSYRVLWPWGPTGAALRRIVRMEQPDIVEVSDKYAVPILTGLLRVGWVPNVPKLPYTVGVSHERLHDSMDTYLGLGGLGRWMARTFLKRYYWLMFDAHVANSSFTAEELGPCVPGRRVPRKLHVLPMGVDCEGLDPANRTPEARGRLARLAGVSDDSRLLVFVGRLAREKNLPLLVDTMDRLGPQYQLILAGSGRLRSWLDERKGGRIHCVGHLDGRRAMADFLAGADAFLHPNPREPFGIAPLEAMAAGVPLVAPNAGGLLSYANESNAWLGEPSPETFARLVTEVFASDGRRSRKLALARETALGHSWPNVTARWFDLFDEVLQETTSGVLLPLTGPSASA